MSENIFKSRIGVKWCPGCGNYAILMSMQKALFSLGIPNNDVVFISGIGCSGRFPYYINTHGFHTLHGRAPAVAMGFKLVQSKYVVWVVIGDGDGFSIGLSHILHMFRRNINVNILFINNKVYGLTKGQYSPTSDKKVVTKSTPFGSLERPINPILMSLVSGCTFVARVVDSDSKHLQSIITKAIEHKGTSFIEVLQNCNIYNNGIFAHLSDKNEKYNRLLFLKHNSRFIFGNNNNLCLNLTKNFDYEVVKLDVVNDSVKHNEKEENVLQLLLAKLSYVDIPFPVGIFRNVNRRTYEDMCLQNKGLVFSSIEELFHRY